MNNLVNRLKEEGQDFEWYPTTDQMIREVRRYLPEDAGSILDIGAGDGRVLKGLAEKCRKALLYSIERSPILHGKQPANIIPVGTNLHEQNLATLQVDYLFSNPIYSEYEDWVKKIIEEGYCKKAFVIIPERWKESELIRKALTDRGATARVIFTGDFLHAERAARAVVNIVEISFPRTDRGWNDTVRDPFDIWFDANVGIFDKVEPVEDVSISALQKRLGDASVEEIVESFNHEYKILVDNYQAIFHLDVTLLTELGIDKQAVREGIKMKMAGLKAKYWKILFDRLDAITSRLTTKTRAKLIAKLTQNIEGTNTEGDYRERKYKPHSNTSVNFTVSNVYSVIIWAIKNANAYFDEQAVTLFRELSTFEGVQLYKSNVKAWEKDKWRYMNPYEFRNGKYQLQYQLDYRIVIDHHSYAIRTRDKSKSDYDYPGEMYKDYHDLFADIKAVMSNLGFNSTSSSSRKREWRPGQWQDFYTDKDRDLYGEERILFQAKGYMNGNVHLRFMPEAIQALNIYAARTLKWVRTVQDVVEEMHIPPMQAKKYLEHNPYIQTSHVPLLGS